MTDPLLGRGPPPRDGRTTTRGAPRSSPLRSPLPWACPWRGPCEDPLQPRPWPPPAAKLPERRRTAPEVSGSVATPPGALGQSAARQVRAGRRPTPRRGAQTQSWPGQCRGNGLLRGSAAKGQLPRKDPREVGFLYSSLGDGRALSKDLWGGQVPPRGPGRRPGPAVRTCGETGLLLEEMWGEKPSPHC